LKAVALDQYTHALSALNSLKQESSSSTCSVWFGEEEADALATYLQSALTKSVENLRFLLKQFILLETMLEYEQLGEGVGNGGLESSTSLMNVRILAPLWSHLGLGKGNAASSMSFVKQETSEKLYQKLPVDVKHLFDEYTRDPLKYKKYSVKWRLCFKIRAIR
jgi:hypothetical protein